MQEMKIGPPNGREHLLRQQSGQKMKLKEKFVEIYDMFLRVCLLPIETMEGGHRFLDIKEGTP